MRSTFVALPVLLLSIPSLVAGDDAPPADPTGSRRELNGQLGASLNNLGLQSSLELSWIRPLFLSKNPLLSDTHVALGVSQALTPSYARVGLWTELSPLSVLDLRLGVEPTVYFGTFHSLMSFDSYGEPFDNDSRDKRPGAGFGTAGRVYVSPTLKMRAGPFVAAASADFEWWKASASGPLFYEPARDTLLKTNGDGLLAASSVLLYQRSLASGGRLMSGLIHQLTLVYDAPANKIQRVGVIVIREFGAKRFGLPHPRVTGVLSYYLHDPSKKHQLSAALALAFQSTR